MLLKVKKKKKKERWSEILGEQILIRFLHDKSSKTATAYLLIKWIVDHSHLRLSVFYLFILPVHVMYVHTDTDRVFFLTCNQLRIFALLCFYCIYSFLGCFLLSFWISKGHQNQYWVGSSCQPSFSLKSNTVNFLCCLCFLFFCFTIITIWLQVEFSFI